MDRQSQRLSEYCAKHNLYVEYIIKDCGSGLNDKRQGFNQLTDLVVKGKVNKVIIEHKDRLTRFQFSFIKKMYAIFRCEVIVLDDKEDVSDAEELTSGDENYNNIDKIKETTIQKYGSIGFANEQLRKKSEHMIK